MERLGFWIYWRRHHENDWILFIVCLLLLPLSYYLDVTGRSEPFRGVAIWEFSIVLIPLWVLWIFRKYRKAIKLTEQGNRKQ
jgi:hypothetical protein